MTEPKRRILARRGAFIAAAFAAACDRCGDKPQPCLSVEVIDDDSGSTVKPGVCLSAPPHACLSQVWVPPDAGTTKEGGAVTLKPIDISADSGASPVPCLSVVPKPMVCLSRQE
jgi:hypothetical protein